MRLLRSFDLGRRSSNLSMQSSTNNAIRLFCAVSQTLILCDHFLHGYMKQIVPLLAKTTILILLITIGKLANADDTPWQLSDSLGLPEWLNINIEHRTRYETLDGQYRAIVNGIATNAGDQALVFRTLVHARVDLPILSIGAEFMDSRIALADSGSATNSNRLTTTIANPAELLQAYVAIPISDLIIENSATLVKAGRLTMDIGSRRLVARNRFRNTINAFTGIDIQWQYQDKNGRAFFNMPIQRRVKGDIRSNHPRFDKEHPEIRFWGLYYKQSVISNQHQVEVFLFGLDENDAGIKTRHRNHYTMGGRIWKKPDLGEFDYQLETAFQTGHSRSSVTENKTLRHNAHFHHAELGYSLDANWRPRLVLQYDYASGDDNPNDNQNNRFDTLFGARRFDFGPTSTYGAFARSNINSPGVRLTLKPYSGVSTMFVVRGFWRASNDDAWTTAGINGHNHFIGTQIEARLRWKILPGNIQVETGFAHLFSGGLMNEAKEDDSTYGYFQANLTF